jgi:hypothetical protein
MASRIPVSNEFGILLPPPAVPTVAPEKNMWTGLWTGFEDMNTGTGFIHEDWILAASALAYSRTRMVSTICN